MELLLLYFSAIHLLKSTVMTSLQQLQRALKTKEDIIAKLEAELLLRDEVITDLKCQLDKYQSILPKSYTSTPADILAPRKYRAQGISAAPQSSQVSENTSDGVVTPQQFKRYSKQDE